MLILEILYNNGRIEESRFCTMEGVLAHLKAERANGAVKYRLTEID